MISALKKIPFLSGGRINLKAVSSQRFKNRSRGFVVSAFRYALLICLAYMILYPLLKMISGAFTQPFYIGLTSSVWIPGEFTLDNFKVSFTILNYFDAFVYTLGSTLAIMALQMLNAALAGYSFARLRFRGSGIMFFLVILTIVVPPSALMLPQYVYFANFDIFGMFELFTGSKMNLLGQPASMFILAALGQGLSSGLFIFIFIQFFRGLPKELEEAAYVDGAGFLRTFVQIVLPTAKPGFMTVGVLSFVWNWNDTYFPRLFNPTNKYLSVRLLNLGATSGGTSVIQQAINQVISKLDPNIIRLTDSTAYDEVILKTCTLLVLLPIIIFFLAIQKQFVQGVERSGIVG